MGTRHVRLATLSLLLLLPAAARADEAAGSMWTLPEESSGTFGLDRGELARRLAAAPP
jgi:hypothetical protein